MQIAGIIEKLCKEALWDGYIIKAPVSFIITVKK